jgi:hypothetical protein
VEKGFEKIILQFTTDFENALLFKGGWGDPILLNNPHFYLPYKKATVPRKKHSSFQGNVKEINSSLMEL